MSLQGFYQIGYVTHDLGRAIKLIEADFDLSGFNHFDVELLLRTPDGEKTACVRVGTAWAGALQIELIQPLSGHVDVYVAGLPKNPDDPTPQFHHLAVRCESEEEMQRNIARLNLPIVFETTGGGISSVFVNACSRIGHHLEYVYATPDGWEMMGWPHSANA